MSYLIQHTGLAVLDGFRRLIASHTSDTIKAIWNDFLDSNWGDLMHGNSLILYLVDNTVMDVWSDFTKYAICPWYHPLASLGQVLTPFVWFFWEILGRSPVFWLTFIVLSGRWVYHDYYRYLAVGRGGTPSTLGGWWRTRYLLFICHVLLRVDVLSDPFVDPMTEPYRGSLFDLEPRGGERPVILGLDPQRQGNQRAGAAAEDAMCHKM